MNSAKNSLAATAKVTGVAAALILGLTLSTGGAAAHVRTTAPEATPATHQTELNCEKDQAAVEATLHVAAKQLQSAFTANHLAIEQLREKAGERNKAARDLLKQADSDVKEIRGTAKAALDAASCSALDTVAIDAIVGKATSDMEAVVADVTATVSALPAPDKKADLEDEDENENEDEDETNDVDHEAKSADHEAKSGEKSADRSGGRSGEKSTANATATSKGHSNH